MLFKNTSRTAKTFYGITVLPGESKEFPGQINDHKMIPVLETKKVRIKSEKKATQPSESDADAPIDTKESKQGGQSDGSDSNQ